MDNPFRPVAGAKPLEIIGRAGLFDEFEYGLRMGSGAPGLITIISGIPGIGKTVSLGSVRDIAEGHGWAVLSEAATSGFMARMGKSMSQLADELSGDPRDRLAALKAGLGQHTVLSNTSQVAWRSLGRELLGLLDGRGRGLVMTLDDVHAADPTELEQVVACVQHFVQERLPVGLLLAGASAAFTGLLRDGPVTFLRRADRIDLQAVAVRDVETFFTETFAARHLEVSPELVHQASDATGGHPFSIQLIGHFLWRAAESNQWALDESAVLKAIAEAHRCNARAAL
jgi:hypothetical protein